MNAQEQITIWLCNDRPVYEYARDVIYGKEAYGDGRPWVALEMLVNDLLYADSGSFYRSLCARIPGTHPVSRKEIDHVRNAIARNELESVNWQEVADELMGE